MKYDFDKELRQDIELLIPKKLIELEVAHKANKIGDAQIYEWLKGNYINLIQIYLTNTINIIPSIESAREEYFIELLIIKDNHFSFGGYSQEVFEFQVKLLEFYIELCDYHHFVFIEYEKAKKELEIKVDDLVKKYCLEFQKALLFYKPQELTPKKYKNKFLNECKSMVTGFLFQPPCITSEYFAKRMVANSTLANIQPEKYVMSFCEKINKAFEVL